MSDSSSRAAGFYDAASPAAPAPVVPDARDAIGNAAARLYGDDATPPAEPAGAPKREPAAGGRMQGPQNEEERRDAFGRAAQQLYGERVETRGLVDWKEAPAADAKGLSLDDVPANVRAGTPEEFQAASMRFREGLIAAGAGPTMANEIWRDAIAAVQEPVRTTKAQAEATLRAKWGGAYQQNLAAARGLIAKAAAVCPEIMTTLQRTGLQNSPELALKLAKWAGEQRARSAR